MSTSLDETRAFIQANTFDIQHAPCAVVVSDICFKAYMRLAPVYGMTYGPQLSFTKNGFFWQCTPDYLLEAFAKNLMERALHDERWFEKFLQEQEASYVATREAWERHGRAGFSAEEFRGFCATFAQWWAFGAVGEDKGSVVQADVLQMLTGRYGYSEKEAQDIINTVSHPAELSGFVKAKLAFLDMCIARKRGDIFDTRAYIDEYFYTKTTYYDREILTDERVRTDIEKEAAQRTLQELEDERRTLKETHAGLQTKKMELLRELCLAEPDARTLKYLQDMTAWVDIRKVRMMKQFYWLLSYVHELADHTENPYANIAECAEDELYALAEGARPPGTLQARREEGMLTLYREDTAPVYFYGQEARGLFAIIRSSVGEEIRGSVACRGKGGVIRGVAQIVLDPVDNAFESGSILVTSMTRPEFIPLMKHALAIVTDEGGIACHAAIVSRELGLPCIIGTKRATQVLQNGDTVELDMGTGIVRKL
jgi:phosphohistidine swiveling domain-containing protein